jgi:hypothetical protein
MIPRARALSSRNRSSFSCCEESKVSVKERRGRRRGRVGAFYFIIIFIAVDRKG